MKKLLIKDAKARRRCASVALRRRSLKYVFSSDLYSSGIRKFAGARLKALSRKGAKRTRLVNCCILSGRAKAVYADFRLSRIQLRELAHSGQLYGIHKSSW